MRKIRYIGIVFLFIVFLCGFRSEEKKVYDDAGLFTEDQIENLQRKCVETAQEKEVDIIVVTADDEMGDKDWTSYADDFYDEHGFGYEKEQGTGILLLIDMKNRQICISTCEEAITYFTDARIDNMLDEIYEYLKDGEYYEGSMIFVDQVKTYMGVSPKKGSDLREPGFGEKMLTRMPFCLIISLAVAGIAVGCMHVSLSLIHIYMEYDFYQHCAQAKRIRHA